MSVNKTHKSKNRFNFQNLKTNFNSTTILPDISQNTPASNNIERNSQSIETSESVVLERETNEQRFSHAENVGQQKGELINNKAKLLNQDQQKSIFQKLKTTTAATLVSSAVMLPILAVGTTTYYFGSQAVNKQAILAKRIERIGLAQTELARQQKLLAALLIGTGTTALLAGAIAAFGTKRLLDSISKIIVEKTTEDSQDREYKDFIYNLNQSVSRQDILQAVVEEAHDYLNCDRVVVYSLNQDKYGVIIAESVTPGCTPTLGIKIQDPCFEARYLDKYRDGRVTTIDNIDEAEMTPCYREQLQALEVKANLVTPIVDQGNLFGLLVAQQCKKPRQWQQEEVEFLHQLAKRVSLNFKNAKLLDDIVSLQTQAATERKWTNYFTDAIGYIRQSLQQDDVLEISVEEVRRVLMCDRVVVYSLNQDKYGVVIAESVTPGYPRALNKTIEDPCFEARYLDKYRNGRVRAIDDIYQAGMTQCYIEQLEILEVKANLVTPILNEGKLFGLLVAHQCSAPRHWQDYEIRWVTQIATQVGFALDNATLLKKLTNDGLPTQLLNNFSLGIREDVNQSELLKIAVEQARKIIKLDRVIVYQFDADWNGKIVAESVVPGYPKALNFQIKDPCFAREYAAKYRQGRIQAIADIHQANLTDCHLEQLESLSVKASIIVPILQNDRLFGLLIGHQCEQLRRWSQLEIDLFVQLALQLGLALDRVELREELNIVKNAQIQKAEKQEGEQQDLDEKLSKLLIENQATLQDLRTKINNRSMITGDFLDRIETMTQEARAVINKQQESPAQSSNNQLNNNITNAQRAIAEVTENVEVLNQSHQNLHQMVSIIDNLKEKIAHSSIPRKPAQLPMGEITVEANEITLEAIDNYSSELNLTRQFVEKSEPLKSSNLMNQFFGEITNLSSQISQQSLFVTQSFQKLAAFAKQLSESEES